MGSDPIASERLTRSGLEWLPPTFTHRSDIPVLTHVTRASIRLQIRLELLAPLSTLTPCFHGLRRHQLVLSFPTSEGVSIPPSTGLAHRNRGWSISLAGVSAAPYYEHASTCYFASRALAR